jgi:hypothetical protein
MALETYQLCRYNLALPHPKDWKMTHLCPDQAILVYWKLDTLYTGGFPAAWLMIV